MGIVDDDIEKVRQASDIADVIGKHVALRRVGRRLAGLCPFHTERSPSFYVNPELGLYKCFGCNASGDVITFVREVEHLDFAGAVEWLAGRAGITLHYTQAGESADRQRRRRLVDAVARAVEWYHERLLSAPDAAAARRYLRSERGFDGAIVRKYRLGWAPEGWDTLASALDLPDAVLRDAGLGFVNRAGRRQDAFRSRVLFPIFDPNGDPVGFGGRILPGGDPPKYKNSTEGPLYAKSKLLYGLNWAKAAVVEADSVIVCEGYTDVIGFDTAGLPRAVATCGTALTDDHARLLSRFARRIVLAFDPDTAGAGAAERFYEWEQKYGFEVLVAALPAGVDPADCARDDPGRLRGAVDGARAYLAFRVERAIGAHGLGSAEARARAAEAALGVIAEHPSDLVRDQYLMDVAFRCRVEPDALRARLGERRSGRSGGPGRAARARTAWEQAVAGAASPVEREVLALLVHRWDDTAPWMTGALFADPVHLDVFRALASTSSVDEAIASLDGPAHDLLAGLAVAEVDADPEVECRHLLAEAATRAMLAVQAEIRATGDLSRAADIAWLKVRIEAVRDPATGPEAAAELLGWLHGRDEERA